MRKSGGFSEKSILEVEDEYLIASGFCQSLMLDTVVIGAVGNLEAAWMSANEAFDDAVMDVDLVQTFACPLADHRRNHVVPYLFVFGSQSAAAGAYRQAPRTEKPFVV